MSEAGEKGKEFFQGKAGGIRCHNAPCYSDGQAHNLAVPENREIFDNPIRHLTYRSVIKFLGVPNYMHLRRDIGYYAVTKDRNEIERFLTPTLR